MYNTSVYRQALRLALQRHRTAKNSTRRPAHGADAAADGTVAGADADDGDGDDGNDDEDGDDNDDYNDDDDEYDDELGNDPWRPLLTVLAAARVVREPLYTRVDVDVDPAGTSTRATNNTTLPPPGLLSLAEFSTRQDSLPAHLFSELASQRWAARKDEDEMYAESFPNGHTIDTASLPFPELERPDGETRAFLVLPWMQMGGSEKCMLDIASRMVDMGWKITFVLTMPFWQEDAIGEIGLHHQWIDRALALTPDTFDLLSLASHDKAVRTFRHLVESRDPDVLLTANTRWMYGNSHLLKLIAPHTVVADYNHMIHMSWEGGGMPRYGANNSEYFDLHLTASRNVADAMKGWIDKDIMRKSPEKVQPCYIGTDPNMLYIGAEKKAARARMREALGISDDKIVILFAGRFIIDKGLDVVADIILRVAKDAQLASRLVFVFVGNGVNEYLIRDLKPSSLHPNISRVIIRPPAHGLPELREYYALSDVLLLPSVNEGIALVLYEAMAAGVLVVATDVGGQKELVTPETGVLLPNYMSISRMAIHTLDKLKEYVREPHKFAKITQAGRDLVRSKYTTEKFCTCVMDNLIRAKMARDAYSGGGDDGDADDDNDDDEDGEDDDNDNDNDNDNDDDDDDDDDDDVVGGGGGGGGGAAGDGVQEAPDVFPPHIQREAVNNALVERHHGGWNRNVASRKIENALTIGVKTYVCDASIIEQVHGLLRSIRVHYPTVRVLLGNDGPIKLRSERFILDDPYTDEVALPPDCGISLGRNNMVNHTTTRYFLLLDDDHVFDDTTNLTVLVDGIRQDQFDLVGLRIRNLPGIDELERTGIVIPRYVGLIRKLEKRELTVCVWNENRGPSIFGITHPVPMDILHNAFIGVTDVLRAHPWRNELKVNEHMTFFLDAKDAHLKVGYLPSVFVHHRARDYSDCYYKVRFREDKYRYLLPYKDQLNWDMKCQAGYPERIRTHILRYELDL